MSRLIIGQITIKKERAISSTKRYYLLQPASANPPDVSSYGNPPPIITTTGYSGWSETEPSYTIGDDRKLYQVILTIYTDGTFEYTAPSLSSSYEASKAAYSEIIQAQSDIDDFKEAGLQHGYIWTNMTEQSAQGGIPIYPVGSYIASGINNTITHRNSNTYGLNTWISTGGIKLRYNAINLAEFNTSNLNFYYPSTSSQQNMAISLGIINAKNALRFYDFNGNVGMELDTSALTFYTPPKEEDNQTAESKKGLQITPQGMTIYDPNEYKGLEIVNNFINFYTNQYVQDSEQSKQSKIGMSFHNNGIVIYNTSQDDEKIMKADNDGIFLYGQDYFNSFYSQYNGTTGSPAILGLYEFNNSNYFLSQDASFNVNKIYYVKENSPIIFIGKHSFYLGGENDDEITDINYDMSQGNKNSYIVWYQNQITETVEEQEVITDTINKMYGMYDDLYIKYQDEESSWQRYSLLEEIQNYKQYQIELHNELNSLDDKIDTTALNLINKINELEEEFLWRKQGNGHYTLVAVN